MDPEVERFRKRALLILVLLALVWGFLTGLAFAIDIWLDPTTALLGAGGIVVLALTVCKLD